MLVDVSDFLPPDYKLPEKESVQQGSLRKVKATEDFKVKDAGQKLVGSEGQGSSSKQGKNAIAVLKPKPSAEEDKLFIVLRRGKVLPSGQKSERPKKRGPQLASRVKMGQSSSSKILPVSQVEDPVKTGGTSKISPTSNILKSNSKRLSGTSNISTSASNISTSTSKISTRTSKISSMSPPPTTALPVWKMKEAEKDVKARWQAKRKKKVENIHNFSIRLFYFSACQR